MCKQKDLSKFKTLIEVADYFKDEKTCLKYIEQHFHGGNVSCPRCSTEKVYRYKDGIHFKCSGCKQKFTLKIGTIFENSNIKLRKWFMAMYLLSFNVRGCSSKQLAKHIGVTRKTAMFMAHRIRKTFTQNKEKLRGVVMVDETFVGGANANRHIDKKVKNRKDRTFKDKHTVQGFIDANGFAKVVLIKSTKNWHIQPSVKRHVEEHTMLVSDEWPAYKALGYDYGGEYNHFVVNHKARKFLTAEGFTTNTVENMWSHLKRLMYGTYNKVSAKHAQKYLDEFTFRFNYRELQHTELLAKVIGNIQGSLPYKQLVYGKEKRKAN